MKPEPMSSSQQPMYGQPVKFPPPRPRQENGWGLAGFIISIAGLIFCGIPSIFGTIISMIGLRKEPRGFAIAGFCLGLVGVLELASILLMMFVVVRTAQTTYYSARQTLTELQLNGEASLIADRWEEISRIPNQAEGNELLRGKRDMYGNSISYETDGASFTLRSAGPDELLDTEDDIVVGPYANIESARENPFGQDIEMEMENFRGQLESFEGLEGFEEFDEQMKAMQDQLDNAIKEAESNALEHHPLQ